MEEFIDVQFFTRENLVLVTHADGTVERCKVSENCEFDCKGVPFVVYSISLNLRKHVTIWDYDDMHCQQLAIIPRDKANRWLSLVAYFCKYVLQLNGVSVDENEMSKSLLYYIKRDLSHPGCRQSVTDRMKTIVVNFLGSTTSESLLDNLANVPVNKVTYNVRSYSQTLTHLSEFFVKYATYSEELLPIHSLSSVYDTLFHLLNYILCEYSNFGRILTDKEDIGSHMVTSILVDVLTDRCSYLLFLQQKSKHAVNYLKQLYRRFPCLANLRSLQDIQLMKPDDQEKVEQELSREPLRVFPYILAYNFHPNARIRFNYETLFSGIENMPSVDEVMTSFLEPVANSLVADYGRYQKEIIQELVAKSKVSEHFFESPKESEEELIDSNRVLAVNKLEAPLPMLVV